MGLRNTLRVDPGQWTAECLAGDQNVASGHLPRPPARKESLLSRLRTALESGRFVVTAQVQPPKGVDLDKCLSDADRLRGKVTAINVPDQENAVMRIAPLTVAAKLVERGLEPICHVTCRDRNRLALQSDLLGAWALGIRNVLCLTGADPLLGDDSEAKPVYDFDSVQLLRAVCTLNQGRDCAGHELEGRPDFFPGAAVAPRADPLERQLDTMKRKMDAGARFFQTQAVYEPARFEEFMDRAQSLDVPVMAGVVVLKSPGMAKYINETLAGIEVPDGIIEELAETFGEERKRKTVEISARIIRELKPLCHGVHIMPLGWDELVPEIIREAELCWSI